MDGNALTKSQATCYYWFTGQCKLSPKACKFTHGVTAYLARQVGRFEKLDSSRLPLRSFHNAHKKDLSAERSSLLLQDAPAVTSPDRMPPIEQNLERIPEELLGPYQHEPHPNELLVCLHPANIHDYAPRTSDHAEYCLFLANKVT